MIILRHALVQVINKKLLNLQSAVLSAITNAVQADVLNQKRVIYNEDSEESCSCRFRRKVRHEYL